MIEKFYQVTKSNAKTQVLTDAVSLSLLQAYADGSNTITITCRVSTGEVLTVFSGLLSL
jgi:hypothetical protein